MRKKVSMNFFKKRREELGLTQRQISDPLKMTSAAVGLWERDESAPSVALAVRLSPIYEVSETKMLQEIAAQAERIAKRNAQDRKRKASLAAA